MSELCEELAYNLKQQNISSPFIPDSMFDTTENRQHFKQTPISVEESNSFSDSPLPEEVSNISLYGIDWSDRAKSTAHCWLPYSSTSSSTSHLCDYISCKNDKLTISSSLTQCGTCLLILHTVHLSESQEITTNAHQIIPSCRPSFVDNSTIDNLDTYDQHYWSSVPILTSPCAHCKHRSSKNIFSNSVRRFSSKSIVNKKAENTNSRLIKTTIGFTCLWCSRSYHRQCWETIKDDKDNSKCDYGKFGNIIVRPQWLCRVFNSPDGFRAQLPDNLEIKNKSLTPVIFFINKRSGGQKGQEVYRTLVRLVNPRQVFLLESDTTIIQALNIYSSLVNIRICICGGDGTVAWVLGHLMDIFLPLENPPTSICPLGTGNDMSRVLGWGPQYKSNQLIETLTYIPHAYPTILDRWKIEITVLEKNVSNNESVRGVRHLFSFINRPKFIDNADQSLYENYRTPINTFFFNYISFGLDAAMVLDYHARRIHDPSKFTSPFKNKILCMNEGRKYFKDFAFGVTWDLSSYIRLICDDQDLTNSIRHCHSLVVLNTQSFGSGTHPWGTTSSKRSSSQSTDYWEHHPVDQISTDSSQGDDLPINVHDDNQMKMTAGTLVRPVIDHFETQNIGDRKIEVLGLSTKQMALIRMGIHGKRIAQCSHVRIELSQPMPVHMDGGPFYLAGSVAVDITHAGQVIMLRNEKKMN